MTHGVPLHFEVLYHPRVVDLLAASNPQAAEELVVDLTDDSRTQLSGSGVAPSVEASTFPDIVERVEELLEDSRGRTLSTGVSGSLGSGLLISRGSLQLERGSGSGLLVIDGDFTVTESFDFSGIVIVLGDVTFEAGSVISIRGSLLQGADARRLDLLGRGEVTFDSELVAGLDAEFPKLLPHLAIVTGWRQEL